MIKGLGWVMKRQAELLQKQVEQRQEEENFDCTIHATVNIWRHSLNERPEVVNFIQSHYGCRNWTWEDIELHFRLTRFAKDIEDRFVDLNVAAIKLVSAVKDITDTEKQVSWHEIVKESNDNSEQ